MKLSRSIWHEITHLLAGQSDKQTLLTLTFVSRTLSALALPALWRDLSSLEDIVFTVNSFAPEDDDFIVFDWYAPDKSDDETPTHHWDLIHPIPEHARIRVSKYLSYVRSYVYEPPNKEAWYEDGHLWPLLPVWLGLDGPLFPRLQRLSSCLFRGCCTNAFLSLLCPSITDLNFDLDSVDPPETGTVSIILDAVVNMGCDLRRLMFVASSEIYPPLLSDPSAFKNLRHLGLFIDLVEPVESYKVPLIDLLSSLPSLNYLSCHTDVHIMPLPGSDIICHNSLRELHISGDASEIEMLFLGFRFPLLMGLELFTNEGTFPRHKQLYETITSRSPMICQFISGSTLDLHPSTLDDLTPLFNLALESVICHVSEDFTVSDMETLVKSLPNLQRLHLSTTSTCFHAAEIYTILSQYPRLEDLEIPVDLQDLLLPPALDNNTTVGPPRHLPSKSHIWELSLDSASNIPSETPQIENLVNNLLKLFPRLSKVLALFNPTTAKEMERIIAGRTVEVVGDNSWRPRVSYMRRTPRVPCAIGVFQTSVCKHASIPGNGPKLQWQCLGLPKIFIPPLEASCFTIARPSTLPVHPCLFLGFSLDPDYLKKTGDGVVALEERLECIFGWKARSSGTGITPIVECGKTILAIVPLLADFHHRILANAMLEKWIGDITPGAERCIDKGRALLLAAPDWELGHHSRNINNF
ncbi:hypothetical protein D9756_008478 [Leucocoprinus leucothites]|uniref:Uncharacterized protein n=1 Tax=Leucocoprinus leucothites TaxID=201217 RepID=A0A8H5CYU2_9AGAR|nr:hypothetical protein D9756_008478 [Leucoagaricus leucothites]